MHDVASLEFTLGYLFYKLFHQIVNVNEIGAGTHCVSNDNSTCVLLHLFDGWSLSFHAGDLR